MNLEYLKYPNESDEDFVYRIKRSSEDLEIKILRRGAKKPENTAAGVQLRKIETENGTRYRYETAEKR